MIKTHKIRATDEVPFVALCETPKGQIIIVAVTEHEPEGRWLKGKIIQGLGKNPYYRTGLTRAFFPYGDWYVLASDNTPEAQALKESRKAARKAARIGLKD